MRSTLLAVLAGASIVSASCAQSNIRDLVAETSCGCINAITQCLETADLQRLDEIKRCYTTNGCTAGAATVEAVWFLKDCQSLETENGREDLRRRADSTDSSTTDEKTTTDKKTTNAKSTTAKISASTTAPSSTDATTTTDSSTTSESSTTALATTASSTTSSSTTTGTSTTTSATAASQTGTLVCSITSTFSTTVCGTTSGKTTCTSTLTSTGSCAPGLICYAASSTSDPGICMRRDDHLTTSGLIVTIIFATALVATVIAFIIMGMRNSKKIRQQEYAQQMAAASSKGADVEAQSFTNANRSEAALPLIPPGGQRSDQYQPQQDYFSQENRGGNSVTPPGSRAPQVQLHGQEPRY